MLQVTSFKLLGLTINNALKWDGHIAAVTSISGFSRNSTCSRVLVYYKLLGPYKIRTRICVPCPVWHRPTSKYRSDSSRSSLIQSIDGPVKLSLTTARTYYSDACTVLWLPSLHDRRHKLCHIFFQQLARNTDNCLRYLLPDLRDSIIINRLRSTNKFPLIFAAKTNKLK